MRPRAPGSGRARVGGSSDAVEYRIDYLAGEDHARRWEPWGMSARHPRNSLRLRKLNLARSRFSTETGRRVVRQPRRSCCKRLLPR
jgi:hypothetical protein